MVMQITDKLGQYNQNVKNGTEELMSAQGAQKLVSTTQELEVGNIFEGTVNSVRNGKVVLALGNGQLISARLDGKVSVTQGESMFFQVRSNDGTTVAIRPYVQAGHINNPILLNALTAAGVPVTERSLAMVDEMMKAQMSIDRQSILDMTKILNGNPDVKVSTLVQMTKSGLPVTKALAAQFENYLADHRALTGEIGEAAGRLSALLGDKSLPAESAFRLYAQIVDILGGKADITANLLEGAAVQELSAAAGSGNAQGMQETAGSVNAQSLPNVAAGEEMQGPAVTEEALWQAAKNGSLSKAVSGGILLEQLFNGEELSGLKKLLQNIPTLTGNTAVFEPTGGEEIFVDTMSAEEAGQGASLDTAAKMPAAEAALRQNMTVTEFLNALCGALQENSQYGFAGVQRLFGSKEFAQILKQAILEQWTLRPEELKESGRVSELYQKLGFQLSQMESAVRAAGVTQGGFLDAAANMQANVEFMNQLNQVYTYVQLPLRMAGQSASGELYVYTNKKNLRDPEAELTAFLHLDLNHLGSTDVSVRMRQKNVKANFYISDDAAYGLVEKHLPVLEKRLKQKGYLCAVTVTNEGKKVGFVEDFLQRDMPQTGTLHRYSFDARA